jgi:hypothetical protein
MLWRLFVTAFTGMLVADLAEAATRIVNSILSEPKTIVVRCTQRLRSDFKFCTAQDLKD